MSESWSPRWRGHQCRPVAEEVLRLRLDRALRAMLANIGDSALQIISRTWRRDGQAIATCQMSGVWLVSGERAIQLTMRIGATASVETVSIDWVPQRLGGRRAWWICPACQRRCGVLFHLLRGKWRCRRCSTITYESSNVTDRRITRMLRSPNLVAALGTLKVGNSIGDLVLRQKADVVMRRRAQRDYRRWFRRTYPGHHLPRSLRRKRDTNERGG